MCGEKGVCEYRVVAGRCLEWWSSPVCTLITVVVTEIYSQDKMANNYTHMVSMLNSGFQWVSEWVKSLSRVQLFVTPWTAAHQAPPSMGFSRQEYWSGLPFPSPRDLPDPGIKPRSPALQADALTSEPPWKPPGFQYCVITGCRM